MKRAILLVVAAVLCLSASTMAQQRPQPPQSWDEAALRSFNSVHDKLIAMCKDTKYPADKESYKPHADSRTFVDELQHVAAAVIASAERLKGGQPNFNNIVASLPKDRAALAAKFEAAKAEYVSAWSKDKPFGIIGLTEHAGEHYGKLVTIYRVNGIVPPASRQGGE